MLNEDCIKRIKNVDFKDQVILNSSFHFAMNNYNRDFIGFELNEEYVNKVKEINNNFKFEL